MSKPEGPYGYGANQWPPTVGGPVEPDRDIEAPDIEYVGSNDEVPPSIIASVIVLVFVAVLLISAVIL